MVEDKPDKPEKTYTIAQEKAYNLVNNLKKLGFTYREITLLAKVSKSSIYRYTVKDRRPSIKKANEIIEKTTDIDVKSNFFQSAIEQEQARLKEKKFLRVGNYIASKGRVDERNAFKVITKVKIENEETLYKTIKYLIKKNLKIWKKRGDYLFYISTYGHMLDMSEGYRPFAITTVTTNGNLKNAIRESIRTYEEIFREIMDRDYIEYFLITEISLTGSHFTVYSFDNQKSKVLVPNKNKRLNRRKTIQKKLTD